jgi:hypothetical protein
VAALNLGPQLAALFQKHPFASARVLVQHFLTSVPTMKEILSKELGLKKFSGLVAPFSVPAQNVADAEASIEMP